MSSRPHITVCIATYKRPKLLAFLLQRLDQLHTEDLFTYSAVVVDNDAAGTARATVDTCRAHVKFALVYDVEPQRNIALARNRAIGHSRGEFVAFIDDDEYPHPEWLLRLFKTLREYNADIVHGYVQAYYEDSVPAWVITSGFFEKKHHATGTTFYYDRATSSCLLKAHLLRECGIPFDKRYGLTGGEDGHFFERHLVKGTRFCWCDEAIVYEYIFRSRATIFWMIRRCLRLGSSYAMMQKECNPPEQVRQHLKWAIQRIREIVLTGAPITFFMKKKYRECTQALSELCIKIGMLMGYAGIKIYEYRRPTGAEKNITAMQKFLKDARQFCTILFFLLYRDVTVRYRNTAIGIAWVVIQPASSVLIISCIFGNFIHINLQGLPYSVFVCVGFLLWAMASEGVMRSLQSVAGSPNLIKKVYFPRIVLPLTAVVSAGIDFIIMFFAFICVVCVYGVFTWKLVWMFPVMMLFCFLLSVGIGSALCALTIVYRDVHNIIPFFIQTWMLLTPIFYSFKILPPQYKWLLYANPLAGAIEWYRTGVGGYTALVSINGFLLFAIAGVICCTGIFIFSKYERFFADIM